MILARMLVELDEPEVFWQSVQWQAIFKRSSS